MAADVTVPARTVAPPVTLPRMLDADEVAHLLGMTPAAFRQMRSRGDAPPCYRFGARLKYKPREVHEWIEEHREKPRKSGSPS